MTDLRDLTHRAYSLAALTGAIDVLQMQGEGRSGCKTETQARHALPVLIGIVTERARALAVDLDRTADAAKD